MHILETRKKNLGKFNTNLIMINVIYALIQFNKTLFFSLRTLWVTLFTLNCVKTTHASSLKQQLFVSAKCPCDAVLRGLGRTNLHGPLR